MTASEPQDITEHGFLHDRWQDLQWLMTREGTFTTLIILAVALPTLIWWFWPTIVERPGIKNIVGRFRSGKSDKPQKNAFLIVSSMVEEWQTDLNHQILARAQDDEIACTVFVLNRPHDLNARQALFRRVLRQKSSFDYGIAVISGWPANREEELINLANEFGKPLVFIDHNPSLASASIPQTAAFVSVSDKEGGQLAAKAICELADSRDLRRILVIKGFAKPDRELTFKAGVETQLKSCEVVIGLSGEFDRQITRKAAGKRLRDAVKAGKPFDAVFCTSDAMTLGCLDAIWRMAADQINPLPHIIGYDGVQSTKAILDDEDGYLCRVVIQDTRALASLCIEQLLRIQKKELTDKKVFTDPPKLYPETLTLP